MVCVGKKVNALALEMLIEKYKPYVTTYIACHWVCIYLMQYTVYSASWCFLSVHSTTVMLVWIGC